MPKLDLVVDASRPARPARAACLFLGEVFCYGRNWLWGNGSCEAPRRSVTQRVKLSWQLAIRLAPSPPFCATKALRAVQVRHTAVSRDRVIIIWGAAFNLGRQGFQEKNSLLVRRHRCIGRCWPPERLRGTTGVQARRPYVGSVSRPRPLARAPRRRGAAHAG